MRNIIYYVLLLIVQVCQIISASPKIIIIGAGPAGLAAATYLYEHNLKNFQILEAESRIGGRINTVKFGNGYVDLGAQWCMGRQGNVVYEKVKELNLLDDTEMKYDLYYSSLGRINEQLQSDINDIADKVTEEFYEDPSENRSYGEYFTKRFNELITKKFKDYPKNLTIAQNALHFFHLAALSEEGSFSWNDISARDSFKKCPGNQNLNWKGRGYHTILNVLMKKIPNSKEELPLEDKILLNKEVKKIIWNRNELQIVCSDKSVYTADHIIFTPSIGVLKADGDTLFEPPLPQKKKQVINKIGFDAVMKVWLYYPEPWCKNVSQLSFGFIWSKEDLESASKQFVEGPNLDGRSWITYIVGLVFDEYNPSVVAAWIVGPLVPQIELLPKDVMENGLSFVINKFLGHNFELTNFTKILPTSWYNNAHFRGTYSYQNMKTCNQDGACVEDELAEPLNNSEGIPVIQFAGEASNKDHYGSVHGAIETGYREAKILVNLYE